MDGYGRQPNRKLGSTPPPPQDSGRMLHRSIYDQDNIKAARGTIHDCLRAVSQDVGFIRALHKAGQRQDITPEYADMLEEILAATRKFVDNWEPKSG